MSLVWLCGGGLEEDLEDFITFDMLVVGCWNRGLSWKNVWCTLRKKE